MIELKTGGYLIAQIHQISRRIFNRILRRHKITDLNSSQGRILFVLWQENPLSIGELSQKTSLSKSTLTTMLDRLENLGYLTRVPSKEDRRSILISLTEKNEILEEKYIAVSKEMTELFYQGFTEEEITNFETYLDRILTNLKNYESR